jgi:hypothetical protein
VAGRGRAGRWLPLLCAAALLPLAAVAQKPSAELSACIAANRQAATELAQARDTEIRRHAMHAVLVSRLQGLGGSFAQLRAAAGRAPRNLAECEKTTEALAGGREQLERIVGTPEQLAECNAANQAGYSQMQATLLNLQAAGKASVPALESAASRLALLRPALNREGLTLTDCRQLATEVEAEKAQVQRLAPAAAASPVAAAPAAPVTAATTPAATPAAQAAAAAPAPAAASAAAAAATACRAAQTREYNDVAQAYARFVSGGPLAQEWMAPLQALSERLTRLSVLIATPGAPGWDCEGVNSALAQARSELGKFKR